MTKKLFTPYKIGDIELSNRIVMAPLTRARASNERIPNDLMCQYYVQRAQAGLIISEATYISEQAIGWEQTPGICTDAQVKGWQRIIEAVHQKGGRMFLQLWHTGRASHSDFRANGALPVSASAVAISNDTTHTPKDKKPYEVPRALEVSEIKQTVQDYAEAALRAKEAGFDGVEIHAANGYLIDQFLRDGVNKRNDEYGGNVKNRARFLLEVTEAVTKAWKPERVGVRLSPTSSFNDMKDSNPPETFTYAAEALNEFGLAYLHILEALPGHFMAAEGERVAPLIRKVFDGPLILNGGYELASGEQALQNNEADLIAYGIPFIANPDLVERFKHNAELKPPDVATFYTPGPKGYTDYPVLEASAKS
jgi:N-ethylmaleimide reductase